MRATNGRSSTRARNSEAARTHDRYWNAAMNEMRFTGYMHNHMRMYWGKKILEWSRTPQEAHATALALNNKYFLDGRDANSFANVAWIFGQHDRPWGERPIFGKVRYMNAAGLERKCDIEAYVAKVEKLIRRNPESRLRRRCISSENPRALMEKLLQDIRFGFANLSRNPASPLSPSSRWRSASEPTLRSSVWSIPFCCDRWR